MLSMKSRCVTSAAAGAGHSRGLSRLAVLTGRQAELLSAGAGLPGGAAAIGGMPGPGGGLRLVVSGRGPVGSGGWPWSSLVSPICSCAAWSTRVSPCVFGIPGEENIRFTDALARSSIRYVLVRHEQAASFMAEIYGRLTGRAGVCSSTLGPGRDQPAARDGRCHTQQHAGGGLLGAGRAEPHLQGVPSERRPGVDVLAGDQVGGHGPHPGGGAGDGPQGVQAGADRTSRRRLPGRARGRRGRVRAGDLAPLDVNIPRPDEPSPSQIGRAAAVLDGARRPIVLAGHGAARSGAAAALAALLRAAGPSGRHHLSRQGRVPRRSSAMRSARWGS